MRACFFLSVLVLITGCSNDAEEPLKMFSEVHSIDFVNKVENSEQLDVFRYRNFYNGGGVSIGDVNGDGLPDLYLTSNLDSNRLYLNKGDFVFEDITSKSGTWGMRAWSTGVTMADVNGDGLLDIYVCNSGNANGDDRENELFINNGDLTFSERSEEYGLADPGWSTHSVFFDFDLDGDLDCYVLNNSFRSVNSFDQNQNTRYSRHPFGGDRLYKNTPEGFINISEKAGILGSEIAFGLGITVSDFDQDGWPDIYISNDFFERDYLYTNNGDGTFTESLEKAFNHISEFSMGADAADLNNDGYPELITTDMLPRSDYRIKTGTSFMTHDVQNARRRAGYYNQYMRNSLQLNNQNGTFSEIGLFSDIAATDWSWGAIIADFDLSGDKDIFVTNGIYHDVIDQDFLHGFQEDAQRILTGAKVNYTEIINRMPNLPLSNYMFIKSGESMNYINVSPDWGLDKKGYSNGAAYGDLDLDGDLDLVINNVNQAAQIFRNNAESLTQNNQITLDFTGFNKNTRGLGAKVWLESNGKLKFYEHFPIRGFQSSMDYSAIIGLGEWNSIESIKVEWPDGKVQYLQNIEPNIRLNLDHKNAFSEKPTSPALPLLFSPSQEAIGYLHRENHFFDFDFDRLLLQMNSNHGPALAITDLNGDGLDDLYLGGALGQKGAIYIQNQSGNFTKTNTLAFNDDEIYEDITACFFDIDSDGDQDLYVVSGGSEQIKGISFQDRLYINEGKRNSIDFKLSLSSIPQSQHSGSCIKPFDFDQDGDIDLFVGSRLDPTKYGIPVSSRLLENTGGQLMDVTHERIPQLKDLGMVTDAVWTDVDNNNKIDLVLVGEWMPITVFKNRGEGFQKVSNTGLEQTHGLWNNIIAHDINGDGLEELFVGNLGLNSRFNASIKQPFQLYINDYDNNETLDLIYAHYDETGNLVPFSTKHQVTMQLPHLKKQFLKFTDYAGKTMEEIFGESLDKSLILKVETLASTMFVNNGGNYTGLPLPEIVQYSTANAMEFVDIDGDTKKELIIGGNFHAVQPELGQYDANFGIALKWQNDKWETIPYKQSGLNIRGDVKHIRTFNSPSEKKILFVRNNDKPVIYEKTKGK